MNKKSAIFISLLTALLLTACTQNSGQSAQSPSVPDNTTPSTVAAQSSTQPQSDTTQNQIASTQDQSGSTQNNNGQPQMITEEEAKKIALDEVRGATLSDIREFEKDYDNGKLEYEGKIYYDQNEIEFVIDGYGAILEWEVEPLNGGGAF